MPHLKVSGFNKRQRRRLLLEKIADVFDIGKHAAANILKNKKKIREHYGKFHKKNKKCNRSVKYKILNGILCD